MDWSSFLPALLGSLTAISSLFLTDGLRRRSDRRAKSHQAAMATRERIYELVRLIRWSGMSDEAEIQRLADDIRGHAIQVADETVREQLLSNVNVLVDAEMLVDASMYSPAAVAMPIGTWTEKVVKAYVNGDPSPTKPDHIVDYEDERRDAYDNMAENHQLAIEDRLEQARKRQAEAAGTDQQPAAEDTTD